MTQRVKLESIATFITLAEELMRLLNAFAIEQQHLNDLRSIVMSRQHNGRDIGRELRVLGLRLPKRIGGTIDKLFVIEQFILWMIQDGFGYVSVTFENGHQ